MKFLALFKWLLAGLMVSLTVAVLGCDNGKPPSEDDASSVNFSADFELVGSVAGLSGSILFLEQRGQPNFRITKLDLGTRESSTLFTVPAGGWVYSIALSPDHQQLALAYSAPPTAGQSALFKSGIYLLDLNDAEANIKKLVGDAQPDMFYYLPAWSPDGQTIYATVSLRNGDLERLSVAQIRISTRQSSVVAQNALWSAPNPLGTSIAYLNVNPQTGERSFILKTDDATKTLIPEYGLYDLDLPAFTPDGSALYLAVIRNPNAASWLDGVFGPPAYAHLNHDLPADWWRISTDNSAPQKIADVGQVLYQGVFSPDGKHFAFASAQGVHVMEADGRNLRLLVRSRAIRSLAWLP